MNGELFIVLFIAVQFITVVVSTAKSILTISGSPAVASVVNAVSYVLMGVLTKFIAGQTFEIIIVTTFFTNLIGVYLTKKIIDRFKKEQLWLVAATIKENGVRNHIEKLLEYRNISFNTLEVFGDKYLLYIFSYSRAESVMIDEILKQYKIKFSISEVANEF